MTNPEDLGPGVAGSRPVARGATTLGTHVARVKQHLEANIGRLYGL